MLVLWVYECMITFIYSLLALYWNTWLLDGAKTETLICFYVGKASMAFPCELTLNHLQVVTITWFPIDVTSVSIVQLFKTIGMGHSFDSNHISFTKLGKQFRITQLVCNLLHTEFHVKCLELVKYIIRSSLMTAENFSSETLSNATVT